MSKSKRVGDYAAVTVPMGDTTSYDIYVITEHMQDNVYLARFDGADEDTPEVTISVQGGYAPGAWPFHDDTWKAELL